MTDDSEPQIKETDSVLKKLLDPKDEVWNDALRRSLDDIRPNPHTKVRSMGRELVIEGETEDGITVTATDTDYTRQVLRTVLDNAGTPYVSGHEEWQTTDGIIGLTVNVKTTDAKGQPRNLTLFLPNSIAPEGVYQRPLQIAIDDGKHARQYFGFEHPEFAGLQAEIEYHLGGVVSWSRPSSPEAGGTER